MRRYQIISRIFLLSVALCVVDGLLKADELLAQSSIGAGSFGFSAGVSTSDGDLAILFDYASSNPHPLLIADAITSNSYEFNAGNTADFNAIATLLADGISEQIGFADVILLNAGGMRPLTGIGGLTEREAFSGCFQSPIHVGCDNPNLGPDLVGDHITSITVTISDVVYENNFTANPGSVGVNYSATALWQIFGTGTPWPSAGPVVPPPPPPIPEPASRALTLAGGIAFGLLVSISALSPYRAPATWHR